MLAIINDTKNKGEVDDSFYLLMSDIDEDSCREVISWILSNNFTEDKPSILNLLICSAGGELAPAMAVIDVMSGSTIPVRTIGLGQIASAALMIFMNGAKGERILTPNTSVMSHQYAGGSFGKHHELMASVKDFTYTQERILHHYERCTKLKRKEILEKLLVPSDVWLSPQEATKFGLADSVKELK